MALQSLFLQPTWAGAARPAQGGGPSGGDRGGFGPSLTLDEQRHVIAQARSLGARSLHLSGGEPTLFRHLPALVHAGHRAGLFVRLETDARRLDAACVATLLAAGLDAALVSIHGASAATHDAITGRPGSFDTAQRGLDTLVRARRSHRRRLALTTQTRVSRVNYQELPEILDRVCRYGVDEHRLVRARDDGPEVQRWQPEDHERLQREILPRAVARLGAHAYRSPLLRAAAQRLLQRLDLGGTERGAAFVAARPGGVPQSGCRTRGAVLCVRPDGSVVPCSVALQTGGPVLGNVREQPLAVIRSGAAWDGFERSGLAVCATCPERRRAHLPVSASLGDVLQAARRNRAGDEPTLLRRVADLAGVPV